MSDARLRQLERAYQADPSEENRLQWLAAKRRAAPSLPEPPDLSGKRFLLKGYKAPWPAHFLGRDPGDEIRRRGGLLAKDVTPELDYLVLGQGREKGKAAATRAAEALRAEGVELEVLDEAGLHVLLRPDLRGCSFVFAGGFECAPGGLDGLAAMVRAVGADVAERVSGDVDFVVIGNRRGKGKAAAEKAARERIAAGATLRLLPEDTFMSLIAATPDAAEEEREAWLDMGGLLVELQKGEDAKRVKKAVKLLTSKPVRLVVHLAEGQVQGVFPSSSGETYGLYVSAEGRYACGLRSYGGEIAECPGQGWGGGVHPCKHLLAFMLGLAQQEVLLPSSAGSWLAACRQRKPLPAPEAAPLVEEALDRRRDPGDWRVVEVSPEGW